MSEHHHHQHHLNGVALQDAEDHCPPYTSVPAPNLVFLGWWYMLGLMKFFGKSDQNTFSIPTHTQAYMPDISTLAPAFTNVSTFWWGNLLVYSLCTVEENVKSWEVVVKITVIKSDSSNVFREYKMQYQILNLVYLPLIFFISHHWHAVIKKEKTL